MPPSFSFISRTATLRVPGLPPTAALLLPLALGASPLGAESQSPAPVQLPSFVESVEPAPYFDTLFRPQPRGFLGADGAASVELDENRTLWIFGDTVIGTLRDGQRAGPMVRNSIAILTRTGEDAHNVEYYWDLTDRIPGDFFRDESFESPYWYWPGTGFRRGDTVYLFLTRLDRGDGPDGFAFRTVDCTLFRIHNPDEEPDSWRWDMTHLGFGNQHFNINTAVYTEWDTLYLLGYDDGPESKPENRRAILARMPLAALDGPDPGSSIRFWSRGKVWASTHDDMLSLYAPGATESSLHFEESIGKYLTFNIQPFNSDFYIFHSDSLTGPWSEPAKIYHIPELEENELFLAYASRAHPGLTGKPGELALTYVVNTRDFWTMFEVPSIYYPRFLRLRFTGDKAEGDAER